MKVALCSWQVRRSVAYWKIEPWSVAITVFDRIHGHARIRHRLSIPIPNVVLAYEWQITRASPRPYLISRCTRVIFFVMYVPLCIMRLHVELRVLFAIEKSYQSDSCRTFLIYIKIYRFYRSVLIHIRSQKYKFCWKDWFCDFSNKKKAWVEHILSVLFLLNVAYEFRKHANAEY